MTGARDAGAPPSAASVLRDRQFGPFFAGNLLSNSGTWFHNIAAAAAIFQATGSSLLVGLVSVLQFVFIVVVAPFAGPLTDRFDRRRLLLGTQVVSFVAAVALAASSLTVDVVADPVGVPLILALTAVLGVAQGFAQPAMSTLVANLVRDEQLETAVALNSVTYNLARVFGPLLGGVVFTVWGATAAFTANALSFLPLIVALLIVRARTVLADTDVDRSGFVAALRFVWRDRLAAVVLLTLAAMSFAADPVNTLTPALAERFARGTEAVGQQVAAFGLGSAVVLPFLGRLRTRLSNERAGVSGIAVVAVGIAFLAASPSYLAALLSLGLAGGGFLVGVSTLTGALHRRLPESMRGRVMALWSVAFLGTRPLGAVVNGAVSDAVGVQVAVTGAALVAVGALVVTAPRLWRAGG